MARGGNIVITLGTVFLSKGIDLFKGALGGAGKLAANVAGNISKALGNVFADGNEQLGGFLNSFGNLFKMIAQGGVLGAAQFAVVKLFETIKDRLDAGKRQLESFAEAFRSSMTKAVDAIERRFSNVVDAIARARQMAGVEIAHRGASAAEGDASKLGAINSRERDALSKASSDSERAVIRANATLERARLAAAEATRAASESAGESSADFGRAHETLVAAENREARARGALSRALGYKIRVLQSENKTETSEKAAEDAIAKAREELAKAEQEVQKARDAQQVALVMSNAEYAKLRAKEKESAEQVAAAEFELAEAEKNAAAQKREDEVKAYNESKELGRQFEEQYEARAKEERRKEAEKILAEEQEKAKEQQKKIGDSIERLLREIRDIEKARARTRKGMETDHKNHNGIFGPYQYGTDENGNISNFTDWDRANTRYAGHDNDEQKAKRRAETDDARMREIQYRLEAGKYVSESDERKLGRWKQFKEERDGEARRKEQIEQLQQQQQTAVINSEKHLKKIKEDLEQFVESGVLQ